MSFSRVDQEQIFESEGLVIAEGTPSVVHKTGVEGSHKDSILPTPLCPVVEAFEYFHAATATSTTKYPNKTNSNVLESPYERYLRLKCELQELSEDLSASALAQTQGKASIWQYLAEETKKLSQQSESLANHPAWKSLPIHDQILQEMASKLDLSSSSQSSNSTEKTSSSVDHKMLLQVEHRIHRLETLLGIHHNTNTANSDSHMLTLPLMQIVTKLEQKVALVDTHALDQLKAKVHALNVELNSGVSSSAGAGEVSKALESVKKIDHLLDQVSKLEAVLEDLPLILLRLKTLEGIHWSASTVATRLSQLEQEVTQLTQEVHSNQSILTEVKTGLKVNVEMLQENLQQMEGRLVAQQL